MESKKPIYAASVNYHIVCIVTGNFEKLLINCRFIYSKVQFNNWLISKTTVSSHPNLNII